MIKVLENVPAAMKRIALRIASMTIVTQVIIALLAFTRDIHAKFNINRAVAMSVVAFLSTICCWVWVMSKVSAFEVARNWCSEKRMMVQSWPPDIVMNKARAFVKITALVGHKVRVRL